MSIENKKTSDTSDNVSKINPVLGYLRSSFTDKTVANGLYAFFIMVVVVAVAAIFNLLVSRLDLTGDLTTDKMYTLTEDTKELIKDVKDDITIYYVSTSSGTDQKIFELVSKYEQYGKNIKVVKKDPVVYPRFINQYTDAKTEVADNSVVVVNNDKKDRYKYIAATDMVQQEYDYQTYQQTVTGIDAEGQITAAINFVTSDKANKMYFVTGHGEKEAFGTSIGGLIKKKNFDFDTIKTATDTEIPKDCTLLAIFNPTTDFTSDEVKKIEKYIDTGKPILIIIGYGQAEKMDNFNSLLNYYCIKQEKGFVIEKSAENCMQNYPYYIIPEINTENEIAANIGSIPAVMPNSVGLLKTDDVSDSITIDSIMDTSKRAYAVYDTEINLDNVSEENSTEGPFMIGASITKKYKETTSKLVVFSSAFGFDEETQIPVTTYANADLLVNSVDWLCDLDDSTSLAIPVKTDSTSSLTVEAATSGRCVIILIFVVPAAILAFGFYVWIRRRKR